MSPLYSRPRRTQTTHGYPSGGRERLGDSTTHLKPDRVGDRTSPWVRGLGMWTTGEVEGPLLTDPVVRPLATYVRRRTVSTT